MKNRFKVILPLWAVLIPLALSSCSDSKNVELKAKSKKGIELKAAEAAFAATTSATRKAAAFAATTSATRKAAAFAA